MDFPAPLGPTIATHSPGRSSRSTSRRTVRPTVAGGDTAEGDRRGRSQLVARRWARRSSARKNGAPMTAVMTPTGISPSSRATRSAPTIRIAPPMAESGQHGPSVRADEHPHDVRDHQPDEPDQPADGDGRRGDERRQAEEDRPLAADVDAQVGGGLLAQEHPVERPRPERGSGHSRSSDDRDGARERPQDALSKLPSRYEKIWRRAAPDRYIAIARPAASSEPERVPGQQQARQRRPPGRPVRGGRRAVTAPSAPRNASTWSRPKARIAIRTGIRTAIAAPSAAPEAVPEHIRVGERVAEQALERGPGDGQAQPHDHRLQDPRQAQVPDDRLGRRRPGPGEVEAEQRGAARIPSVSPGGDRDAAERDARAGDEPRPTSPATASATGRRRSERPGGDRPARSRSRRWPVAIVSRRTAAGGGARRAHGSLISGWIAATRRRSRRRGAGRAG